MVRQPKPAWGASVLFLMGTLLTGCADTRDPASPASGATGTVTGSVTRHKTGAGVANLVAVLGGPNGIVATAATDASGRFVFADVPAGSYDVRLTGRDIALLDARFDAVEPESTRVVVDGSMRDVIFAIVGLVPPRVAGDVVCAGVPAAGARIRVAGGAVDTVVTANAQGRYAALDLMPGHYAVLPVDAPCALTPVWNVIELRPGQTATADFTG